MAQFRRLELLTSQEIEAIHGASLTILRDTGIQVHHAGVLRLLEEAGAQADAARHIARLPERLVLESVERAFQPKAEPATDGSDCQ